MCERTLIGVRVYVAGGIFAGDVVVDGFSVVGIGAVGVRFGLVSIVIAFDRVI